MSDVLSSPAVQGAIVTIVVAVATVLGSDLDAAQVTPIVAAVLLAAAHVYRRVRPVPKEARGFTVTEDPLQDYIDS